MGGVTNEVGSVTNEVGSVRSDVGSLRLGSQLSVLMKRVLCCLDDLAVCKALCRPCSASCTAPSPTRTCHHPWIHAGPTLHLLLSRVGGLDSPLQSSHHSYPTAPLTQRDLPSPQFPCRSTCCEAELAVLLALFKQAMTSPSQLPHLHEFITRLIPCRPQAPPAAWLSWRS